MPSDSSGTQPKKPRRPLYQRWWVWFLLVLGAGSGGTAFAVHRTLESIEQKLPDTADILTYVRDGTLTIKADDGSILQQLGPATRDRLTFEQIPQLLSQAFVAAEDKNFYTHNGVDYQAILRATLANLTAGEVVEGGSTITQQLSRIVFLDQERSMERKLREALLAQKVERNLDKEQIIERYLNLVYLGSGAYGVADAAWIYFSKSVQDLTLSEMAMIAGLAPAPSAYSPLVDLAAAQRQRNTVLDRMLEAEIITQAQRDAAIAEPLDLNPSLPKHLDSETPYFTSYIQQQLAQLVSPEDLEFGGLTVETTLNPEWQKIAETAVENAIDNYGGGQGFRQASMVSIDPRTGAIKTMVGGDDFNESQFNRVTQAQRQPGSTFKALVYTTAIATGVSPEKSYIDAKYVVDGYEPQNYGREYRGNVSLRAALISSVNIVAVKVLVDIGFDPVIQMAQRMGIRSPLLPTYSLALGASEVNLLELTSAYGTLAAQGEHFEPHGIVRILDRYGSVLYEADYEPERAVDADTAAIMTWMLRGVVEGGTGARAQLGRPVAGKTGTSEERRDLWFIGYIPQLVTGVWLGNDDSRPTYGASSTAARTWRDFMAPIVEDMPVEEFPALPSLNNRRGTVEAEPVRPQRVTASRDTSNSDDDDDRRSTSVAESEEDEGTATGPSGSSGSSDSSRTPSPSNTSSPEGSPAPAPPPRNDAPATPVDDPAPAVPDVPAPPPAAPPPPVVTPVQPGPEPAPLQSNPVAPAE